MKENAWLKYDEKAREKIFEFCEDYKDFLSDSKTERESVENAIILAKKAGFKDLKKQKSLKPGDKVYVEFKDKCLILFRLGKKSIEEGVNILGAHVDSPRIDVKQTPLYEDSNLCYFDTHYYGGIKKYQYLTIPLAIHGVIFKKDGTKIDVKIGEDTSEPVFCINDLLPHLEKKEDKEKKINSEKLDLLVGSIPVSNKDKDEVKKNILKILKSYGISEEDLASSELELVPAGRSRDLGLDKSMIVGYGQDDKVCAYTSLRAIMDIDDLETTAICILTDKEEIGSDSSTGMKSKYFENYLAEVMNLLGDYSELKLRRALMNSRFYSNDVTASYDPLFKEAYNKNTEALLGSGISFVKYTGSSGKGGANDANPEFIAQIRYILDKEKISYQFTEMGKVDQGGGGTIAMILAEYGMEVIDSGPPILNMHSPCEITSKVDVYETYIAYKALIRS